MYAKLLSDRGDGRPVLYVPGIDGTGDLLLGCAERLQAGFRLLRFRYDAGPEDDGYDTLARSIAELAVQNDVPRCLVLCESFGGAVGLQLALEHPKLVAGVMVVNSFAHYPEQGRLALSRMLAPLTPRSIFRAGRYLLAPHSLFGKRDDGEALRLFRELHGSYFDAAFRRRLDMIAGLNLEPRLGEIQQPVALFASDHDRVVPSLRTMASLQKGLPQATLEVVLGGGHMILPLADEPWPERMAQLAQRAGMEI
jgi:pimeloyl-ACP methyl ester carboxylesterase